MESRLLAGIRDTPTKELDPDAVKVIETAASRARIVEFFYEDPDPAVVEIAHAGGALVSWQVGSRDEAIAAEKAGVDLIVAQGTEAGGHVRGKIGLLPLLGAVLPAVQVPVLAAGGIGTGRAWRLPSRRVPPGSGSALDSWPRKRRTPIRRTSTSSSPRRRKTRS